MYQEIASAVSRIGQPGAVAKIASTERAVMNLWNDPEGLRELAEHPMQAVQDKNGPWKRQRRNVKTAAEARLHALANQGPSPSPSSHSAGDDGVKFHDDTPPEQIQAEAQAVSGPPGRSLLPALLAVLFVLVLRVILA
jgi:hypothetical protein